MAENAFEVLAAASCRSTFAFLETMVPTEKGYLTTFMFYLVLAFSVLHLVLGTFFFTKVFTILAVFVFINGAMLNAFNPKHTTLLEKIGHPPHLISHALPLLLILAVQWLLPIRRSFHFLPVWFTCMLIVAAYYVIFIVVRKEDNYLKGNVRHADILSFSSIGYGAVLLLLLSVVFV